MQNLRQVMRGIVIALISTGILFGGFSLSLAEGDMTARIWSPTSTPTPIASPTWLPFTTPVDTPVPPPPTWTPTLPPPPTDCPPPVGWLPYVVEAGDTLDSLAVRYRITSAELAQANCLLTAGLFPGAVIYIPPVPTQTPVPCGPPRTWTTYIVQPGDTLYRLSQNYGIAVTDLQRANCMGYSTLLHVGQKFYVPPWPIHTPTPTRTGTSTITATRTPVTPTLQTPNTPTASSTSAPTAASTASETPTEPATATPLTPSP